MLPDSAVLFMSPLAIRSCSRFSLPVAGATKRYPERNAALRAPCSTVHTKTLPQRPTLVMRGGGCKDVPAMWSPALNRSTALPTSASASARLSFGGYAAAALKGAYALLGHLPLVPHLGLNGEVSAAAWSVPFPHTTAARWRSPPSLFVHAHRRLVHDRSVGAQS